MFDIVKCCICGNNIDHDDDLASRKIKVKRESCFSDTIIIHEFVCGDCDKPTVLTVKILRKIRKKFSPNMKYPKTVLFLPNGKVDTPDNRKEFFKDNRYKE